LLDALLSKVQKLTQHDTKFMTSLKRYIQLLFDTFSIASLYTFYVNATNTKKTKYSHRRFFFFSHWFTTRMLETSNQYRTQKGSTSPT